MRPLPLFILIFSLTFSFSESYSQGIRIDHVITVVHDIEEATAEYQNMGFSVKPGRLHANGLINAHIKFENQSSFELMSIQGKAKDAIAQNYETLLREGEGSVFVALTGLPTDSILVLLSNLDIDHTVIPGKAWTYITFPPNAPLAHFFFIENHFRVKDSSQHLTHNNGAIAIQEVQVEGDQEVVRLLEGIGLERKKDTKNNPLFSTPTGDLRISFPKETTPRHRIREISFFSNVKPLQPIKFSSN